MGIRIIYGKAGTGKSKYCFKEIAKKIKEKEKIYIITPEQFSFTAEKKLMEEIEGNAAINAEVLTFNRMAYRILNEIGGRTKTNLSECGRMMLIYSILDEQKSKLKFLNKTEENIELISTAITEFKKHGVTPKNIEEMKEKTKDTYLKIKLNDLNVLYKAFEEKIQKNYIDEHDLLSILAEKLEHTHEYDNSLIYIDEFAGFTKQEYDLIKKLSKVAKQITITVCTDNLEKSTNPDTDIFYSNKITLEKIKDLSKQNKIKLEEPIQLKEKHRFKTEELKHLEENMYEIRYQKYQKECKNLSLFLAQNNYTEIENVAKQIVKLVRDKGYRYKDISIITKNIETYSSLAKVIFSKYNIPVFIDEKRDLSQNILVKYIIRST